MEQNAVQIKQIARIKISDITGLGKKVITHSVNVGGRDATKTIKLYIANNNDERDGILSIEIL